MKSISVQNMDGNSEQISLVSSFIISDINKKFAILSKGETAPGGTSKLYVSEIFDTGGAYKFVGIVDEVVWEKVKDVMKKLVQGGVVDSFRYESSLPAILEGYRIIGIKQSDLDTINKNSAVEVESNVESSIDNIVPSASDTVEAVSVEEPVQPVPDPVLESAPEPAAEVVETPTEAAIDLPVNPTEDIVDSPVNEPINVESESENVSDETDVSTDRFDQFLMDTQKILEDTRDRISELLDDYDRRIMELATGYIDELEEKADKIEIENEAYRKAIGKVIDKIKIDE